MKNGLYFLQQAPLREPCSFSRSYKYQLFNFLLDLKAASTELAHIRVHKFLCFLYFGQVSNAFQKDRIHFTHSVNCHLKLMKSEKIFSQLCYRNYHRGSCKNLCSCCKRHSRVNKLQLVSWHLNRIQK